MPIETVVGVPEFTKLSLAFAYGKHSTALKENRVTGVQVRTCSVGYVMVPKYTGSICSVHLPYRKSSGKVRYPAGYPSEHFGKVRYELDTGTRHFGKFGTPTQNTRSVPVYHPWLCVHGAGCGYGETAGDPRGYFERSLMACLL